MNRVPDILAGVLDPGAGTSGLATVGHLAEVEDAEFTVGGPLAVASTRPAGRAGPEQAVRCWVAGRVHNADLVADRLGLRGPTTPEDVLAAAYLREGDRFLESLRGCFALLLWDPARRRALMAQDQLGGTPIFTLSTGSRLLFASDVRHLLRLAPRRPGPDQRAMVHWLVVHSELEHTLYEGVHRLGGAHLLEWKEGSASRRRYWAPTFQRTRVSREEAVTEIRSRLAAAVQKRADRDAPTGVLLSGGVDSTTVTAVAREALPEAEMSLRTYSAVFPHWPSVDESAQVKSLTSALGLPSTRIAIDGRGALALSLEFLQAWDLPLQSPGLLIERPLLRAAAADGVNVVMDGQGGDELFGRAPYLLADLLRRGRVRSLLELTRRFPEIGPDPARWQVKALLKHYAVQGLAPHFLNRAVRRRHGPERYAPGWLTPDSARAYMVGDDPWAWKRSQRGPRWWAQLADLLTLRRETASIHDYLRRRSALEGLEARPPLLDLDLVELMLRVQPELSFDPERSRPLVREATTGLMPDDVRLRPQKSNFAAYYHSEIVGSEIDPIRRLLLDPGAEVYAYADRETVRRDLLDRPPAVGEPGWFDWAPAVWNLATAECWLRSQSDPGFPERMLSSWGLASAGWSVVDTGQRAAVGAPGD